jgi:hypothetical protein
LEGLFRFVKFEAMGDEFRRVNQTTRQKVSGIFRQKYSRFDNHLYSSHGHI